MNLRLVVIDDEVLVRKGIISSVDWGQYGIEVAGEATDGQSALELIRRTKPHIVLTDIRMPHMDGLEMIRLIRDELPDTKIFILSVLDDFQTVREALRLGVIDYIPKLSMTPEELLEVVLSVKGKITSAEHVDVTEVAANRASIKEEELSRKQTGHPAEICDEWIKDEKPYRIAKIKAEVQISPAEHHVAWQKETVLHRLTSVLDESIRKQTHLWYAEEKCFWMLFADGADNLVETLSGWRTNLAPELLITMGLSGPALGRSNLDQAARQAVTAMGRSFYYGRDGLYVWDEHWGSRAEGNSFIPKEVTNTYFSALDADSEGTADRIFRQMFPAQISEELPQMVVRDEVYQWVSTVSLYVKERGGNLHSALSGVSPFEQLSRLETYPDIREWCFRLHDVVKSMLFVLRNAHRREITKAIDYAQMNYMLPIRVKEIAQWVHLSENYFSNVFTKETGKTFSQFLQEIRIEQAKRLLKEEERDWIQVGEQVGFENPKYFTKVFKKFTGVTPKQYIRTRK